MRSIAVGMVFLGAIAALTAFGRQSSPPDRPWPPGVQPVSNESPALSPDEALKTFYMPPGYRVELVASEPLIQEPVAIDWDLEGRLWAVEMPGFMADLTGSNEHDPIGRVVVLEDANGLDAIQPSLVTQALEDGSREIRLNAVRLAERWLAGSNRAIADAIQKRVDDPDAAVRRQVAASLGAAASGLRDTALTAVLERHGDDPITMDAALSGLRDREAIVLRRLTQAGGAETPQRLAAVTMLAATIVRSGNHAAIHQLFALAADGTRSMWQRSALMRGAEVALLGVAMPGAKRVAPAPVAAANLPCPTCPGGRAGPGGAYAFQRPGDPTLVNRAPRRGPALRLDREPGPLAVLAGSADGLGARAVALLAAVTWPGKRGEAVIAPLSAVEQQRFDAGREVYRNICRACHQADGRGQEKLAPSLIVSPLALGNAGIPARILLNGKEGPTGLMPPIGSALNDDQIAAVLTYIRREWGNAATPVDPALIKTIRALTAGRAKPWTDAELLALPNPR